MYNERNESLDEIEINLSYVGIDKELFPNFSGNNITISIQGFLF